MKKRYDYVVVGARCAGASTAMLLARKGAKVLMIDKAPTIGDTLSTHALMRPAVMLLDQWGLLEHVARETPAVPVTHFQYGHEIVSVEIAPFGNAEGLYAPRRTVLDGVLLREAVRAGVEVEMGASFEGVVTGSEGQVTGVRFLRSGGSECQVECRVLIGADGRLSAVAKHLKAQVLRSSDAFSAVLYGYFAGLPNDGYRWYFGDRMAGGVIPTCNDAHCVFIGAGRGHIKSLLNMSPEQALVDAMQQWNPDIADSMQTNRPLEALRRFGGAPGHVKKSAGPGWALVGDAGYFKDPCTGHGISDAFIDAQRLTEALLETPDDARDYELLRNRSIGDIFETTQEIAGLDWSMDRLKALHKTYSKAVKHESDLLNTALPLAA